MKPPWDYVLTFFVGIVGGWVANWLWHKYSRWRRPKGEYLTTHYANRVFEFEGRSTNATLAQEMVKRIFTDAEKSAAAPATQPIASPPASMPKTTPVTPTVVTKDATDITANSAILHGEIRDGGTANSGTISFQLGLSPGNYTSEFIIDRHWIIITWDETSSNSNGPFADWSITVPDLTPNTTYYFRVKAIGDGTGYGVEKSFTTLKS